MLRQSSSRIHRSRGLKLKKALQISLLVLVSVWLIYQVKHSYEKKAYNESEANDLHKDNANKEGEDVIKLGRKDLPTKMEADSSTLDERIEDEENEEMEQELKHDEVDEDPIDERDIEKDDDLPEPGEHSADKDGAEDVGVFEDEERKERSQEDQEKTFHGDNVASAVTHDPPSSERDELLHHPQEKILFVDDASTAVPNEKEEAEREEEARKAREKTFRGDDVSSSVDHDAKLAKPLPEEQLKSMDRTFEGTTNLSNGITFQGSGVNGSNAAGQLLATPADASLRPDSSIHSTISEGKTDTAPVNMTSNFTRSDQTNSTSLNGQSEQQINSTVVLNNQIQLFTDLTSPHELNSPPNGTVATEAQKATSIDRDNDANTGTSSTPLNNKVEDGDTQKDLDLSTKIMNKAISEDEVILE